MTSVGAKKAILLLGGLLILSLIANYYLYLASQKTQKLDELLLVQSRGFTENIGALNDTMVSLSESDWRDTGLLSSAVRFAGNAEIYAQQMTSMTNYLDHQTGKDISNSEIGYVHFYLKDITSNLDHELSQQISGETPNKKLLEEIKNNLSYACYPGQKDFSWSSFSEANKRLLEKD